MSNIDNTGIRWEVRNNLTPRGLLSTKIINAVPASQSEVPVATITRPPILRAGREYVAAPAPWYQDRLLRLVAAFGFVLTLIVIL